MKAYNLMTPGPTNVNPKVLEAMAHNYTNPDLDPDFFKFYAETAEMMNTLVGNTTGETYILCGEGILGLEAACASFIEKGDRVLTIANGIFGKGFGDFSRMYGGEVVDYDCDPVNGISVQGLEAFIDENGPFKMATLVHCETPSGLTNPVSVLGPLLRQKGILSIVDAVSAIGGEAMEMADWQLDVVLCGSQKALSAPPGLTLVSLSGLALKALEERKTPVAGFYTNLQIWKGYQEKQWFPYTQPIHMIASLRAALEAVDKGSAIDKHERIGKAVRQTVLASGLELFAESSYANTVTTIKLPKGIDFKMIFNGMKEDHQILIGGGFDFLENKIFRIGHMGENCSETKLLELFGALDQVFDNLSVPLKSSLKEAFQDATSK